MTAHSNTPRPLTQLRQVVAAVVLATFVLGVLRPALAWADAEYGGTRQLISRTIAKPTLDAPHQEQFELGVHHVAGDVTADNGALALVTCDDCRAAAVTIQVIIASNAPERINARNEAAAVNNDCARCTSYAAAHQLAVLHGGRARLSPHGRASLEGLRERMHSLSCLAAPAELDARIALIVDEVIAVLQTEVVLGSSASAQRTGKLTVDPEADIDLDGADETSDSDPLEVLEWHAVQAQPG